MGRTYLKVERLEPWLSGDNRAVLSNPLREAFAVGSLHSAPNRGDSKSKHAENFSGGHASLIDSCSLNLVTETLRYPT